MSTSPSIAVVGGAHAWPLLRASGARIRPVSDSVAACDRALAFVEVEYGATVLGPVQNALEGAFDGDDGVVFDRDHAMAFLYVKELRRRGELPGLPPIHLFDLIVHTGRAARRHGIRQLRQLADHLERLTSTPVSEGALREAAVEEEHLQGALRALQARRAAERLDGATAKEVLAARRSQPAEVIAGRAADVPASPTSGPRVLVVPAASTESTRHHELVARAGGVVVDEDDWHGGRSVLPSPASLARGVDELLPSLLASAGTDRQGPAVERTRWYEARVASGDIDAVAVVTGPEDQHRGWEAPYRRRVAERHGVPFRHIHADAHDEGGASRLDEELASLIDEATKGERA